MLPEAHLKESIHTELASPITTCDHIMKMRTLALNKARGLLSKHGIKVGRKVLRRRWVWHEWIRVERMELEAIAAHCGFSQ